MIGITRPVTIVILLLIIISMLVVACKPEIDLEEKTELRFGTGVTASDELDSLSRAVARAIEKRVLQFDVVSFENNGGTTEVISDIGRYDLCGISLDDAAQAYHGFFAWKGQPQPKIRLLWVMGILPIAFIVSADSGITSIAELEGKPFGNGGKEDMADFKATRLLEALNVKPQWNRESWVAQVDLYQQGKIVGFTKYGALDPLVLRCNERRPLVILNFSEADLVKANKRYEGTGLTYPPCLIRLATYPKQEHNITTTGLLLGYYAQEDLPAEVAHKIIEAVWQDVWDVSVCYEPLKLDIIGFPKLTLEHGPFPLHPGAVTFYRELELEVPQRLLPPEMR